MIGGYSRHQDTETARVSIYQLSKSGKLALCTLSIKGPSNFSILIPNIYQHAQNCVLTPVLLFNRLGWKRTVQVEVSKLTIVFKLSFSWFIGSKLTIVFKIFSIREKLLFCYPITEIPRYLGTNVQRYWGLAHHTN